MADKTDLPGEQQSLTLQQALDLAVQHHNAGDLSGAENIYQQILQADPDHPVALHLLGVIAHQGGDNEKAADLINKSLTLKPDYAEAYCNLGIVFKELGKIEEAVSNYRKAIGLKPNYAEAYNNLGTAFDKLGQLDDAVDCYENALRINPDYASAHLDFGNLNRKLEKFGEAIESYLKAIVIKPDYVEASIKLGLTYKELGKLPESIESIQKAIELKPDSAEAHYALAITKLELNQLESAIASFRKSLEIKPGFKPAHKEVIRSLNKLGAIRKKQKLREDGEATEQLEFFDAYLQTLGAFNACGKSIVNGKEEAIPLLTNSFLHWFETVNWSGMNLLELGSGNSTLYFSKYFDVVSSYENDESWYNELAPKLPSNVNYFYENPIRSAIEQINLENYDVILLDASENRAKLARIISKAAFSGLIFLDNSEWYRKSSQILSLAGFAEIPYFGIKPIEDWVSCTSVLVKADKLANWFCTDWGRLPDLAMPLLKTNNWDDESLEE